MQRIGSRGNGERINRDCRMAGWDGLLAERMTGWRGEGTRKKWQDGRDTTEKKYRVDVRAV